MSKKKQDPVHNRYREEDLDQEVEQEVQEEVVEETLEESSEVIQLKEDLKQATDKYLRVLAEHENYKKRTQEELTKHKMYATQDLLEKLIQVTDIFDAAVSVKTEDEKLKNFLIGFQMINENFKQILESEGVKKIKALGEQFDPRFHMAVETEYDAEKEEGLILAEFQTGYEYKNRILRPSRVKVNQKKGGKLDE